VIILHMSGSLRNIPKLAAISGSLVGLVGALVALLAVGGGSPDTGLVLGIIIGLAFLMIALGIVIGLMMHAQRDDPR
jgi:hypothetical protein